MRDEALPDGTTICTKDWKESDLTECFQISEQQTADSTLWSTMDVDGNEHPAHMRFLFLRGLIHSVAHVCASLCKGDLWVTLPLTLEALVGGRYYLAMCFINGIKILDERR